MIGRTLGPFEITAKLGEGGMGVVYRASDSHLGREVALKVLPEGLTGDAERLQRFEREAKLLAQLNHPNIAQVHGLEVSAGVRALVMELVEGPTLSDRLSAGPLLLAEALAIAVAVARALEAAHEKGIVHRDLKPQNIKASPDGVVKVLDFGLAKAMETASPLGMSPPELANSPTISAGPTRAGVILGTAAYMAPEQARGLPVDKRADIWAFGVVLYEMLTGERLFAEGSVVDTLSAVVRKEIDLGRLPETTPPAIGSLLRRCLERNPTNRLHDIADARLVIDDVLAGRFESATGSLEPATARSRGRERFWIATASLLALLAAVLAVRSLFFRAATAPPRIVRFLVAPPEKNLFAAPETGGAVALSPDGRNLLFVAIDEKRVTRLWLRALDSVEERPIPGTEGASYPFWSPDSRFVAYFAGGQLRKVGLSGAPPQRVCEASEGRGGSWGADDTIVFAPWARQPLYRVSAAGGSPTPVTELQPERGDLSHRFPSFLADGRRFVYLAQSSAGTGGVYVGSLSGEKNHALVSRGLFNAVFAAPDILLYPLDRALIAQSFDASTSKFRGDPVLVAPRVILATESRGYGSFSAAGGGVLAFQSGDRPISESIQLRWYDRAGRQLGAVGPENSGYRDPALSPDQKRIAVNVELEGVGTYQIFIVDAERGSSTRFTFDSTRDWMPVWSPDGRWIAFACSPEGTTDKICRRPASGAGEVEVLFAPDDRARPAGSSPGAQILEVGARPTDWSADGRYIVFELGGGASTRDLWALPLDPAEKPFPLVATAADEGQGQLSRDGHWLAYVSNESGRYEIYVQPFIAGGGKWQVSTGGGTQPRWRQDGGELFFLSADQQVVASDIRIVDGAFEPRPPQALFQARIGGGLALGTDEFVPSPDGERFLISTLLEEPGVSSPIQVILNWSTEMERP